MTLGMGALRTLTELLPSNFHKTTGLGLSVFSAAGEGSLQWGEQEKAEGGHLGPIPVPHPPCTAASASALSFTAPTQTGK